MVFWVQLFLFIRYLRKVSGISSAWKGQGSIPFLYIYVCWMDQIMIHLEFQIHGGAIKKSPKQIFKKVAKLANGMIN